MKEVLEFEDIIRRALPRARVEAPFPLVQDANNIMRGLPTSKVTPGATRKERLRGIAEQMKQYLPVEPTKETIAMAAALINEAAEHAAIGSPPLLGVRDHDDDMFDGDGDPDEGCSNKGGHEFVEEDTEDGSEGRSYCCHCLADGDA